MKKQLLFLLIFFFLTIYTYSQTLERQTISTSGGISDEDSGRLLLFNVGEAIISTSINGNFVITQGFEQPDSLTSMKSSALIEYNIYGYQRVYPNPASQNIFVELMSKRHSSLMISLIDNLGKEIFSKEVILETGIIQNTEFNISDLAHGQYYFLFRVPDGAILHTVKWQHL
jgi:hypothetical protein